MSYESEAKKCHLKNQWGIEGLIESGNFDSAPKCCDTDSCILKVSRIRENCLK